MRRLVAAALAVGFSLGAFAHDASAYPSNCSISWWRSYCATGDADDAHRPRRTCYFAGSNTTIYTYAPYVRVGVFSQRAGDCPSGYSTVTTIVQKLEHY